MFTFHDLLMPHSFNILLIDWSKVPHNELVSDLEDNAKVVEVKAEEKQRREEEVKAEHCRQKEVSNKCITCCGDADNNWHRHEKQKKRGRQRKLRGQKRPKELRSTGQRWCDRWRQCVDGRRQKGRK